MRTFDQYLSAIQQDDPEMFSMLQQDQAFPLQMRLPSSKSTGHEVSHYDAHGPKAVMTNHDMMGQHYVGLGGTPLPEPFGDPGLSPVSPPATYRMDHAGIPIETSDGRHTPRSLRNILRSTFQRA